MRGPFKFGRQSQTGLITLHYDLQIILQMAIKVYDFSITQGSRTVEEQIRNIRNHVSKTINSRHIPRDKDGHYDPSEPCRAVDVTPYQSGVNPWPQDDDTLLIREKKAHRFYFMQGIFYQIASAQGIDIIQGVDWDMDGDIFDQKFDDLSHLQLASDPAPLILSPELLDLANEALVSVGLPEYEQ